MKILIFLVCGLLGCSMPFLMADSERTAIFYYRIDAVNEVRHDQIKEAIVHLEENVKCLSIRPYNNQKINHEDLIYLVSTHYLSESYIGLTVDSPTGHIVFLPNYQLNSDKTLQELDKNMFFKIVIHEMAHAMGMSGHPFSVDDSGVSLLAPQLNPQSGKFLYTRDVQFLNKMLCNIL